ncbi:lipopolysaccharide biosynthesis protein [Oribacterium sp. WCC10]|uniref:lipopolysaccharide biosynthesis protein n=1 Tax=Oribacterium sp. WCC10 TaxID=1855343 RepID=UPI0008F3AED7|nr:hypothetical protein [Oribacterium sp. WCC10]SFG27498.1 Membrane protein involved in the export of O-antigen and teichoic acid [Oribacterium sp. WCC10]
MERTANTRRNIVYGFLQVLTSLVLPFIVRTIIIYRFGVDYLGLNSLFTSIISVLSLMELGFGSAVVYSMYKPVAEGDNELVCAYLAYFKIIYRFIGLSIMGVGLLLVPFLSRLIRDPSLPEGLNLYSTYLIFLANSVISYLLFGYVTVIPTAFQRQDVLSRIQTVMTVAKCIIQSAVLLCSKNFYLYFFAMPLVTVIQNLLTAYIVRERYPEIECRGEINEEQKTDLKEKVKGLLINRLTNASRNSIDSMCISAFIGLAMTGMYNNYLFIMTGILSCTVVIMTSMTPSVGNSIVTESKEKNYNDLRQFDFMYMGIVTWATVCMLCLYQPFIITWIGNGMVLRIAVGMSLYFFVLNSGSINWVYLSAAGLWYETRWCMIGELVGNIVLNVILCKVMGIYGIVLATIVTVSATNLFFYPRVVFTKYFKNGKLKEFWLDHAAYTFAMILTAGLSWILCAIALPIGMLRSKLIGSCLICLIGRLIIATLMFVAVLWVVWHKSERYRIAMVWMKKLVRI